MAKAMLSNIPVQYNGSLTDLHKYFGFMSTAKSVLIEQVIRLPSVALHLSEASVDAVLVALVGGQQ